MPNRSSDTIRPARAGSLPEDTIHRRRKGRRKTIPGLRSTTRTGQAWKSVISEDGTPEPVKCPGCGSVIVFDKRGFAGCGECTRTLSRKEREELEARDPEMIPVRRYMGRMEEYPPTFEGHANLKRISGKERREKRFLSKCAAMGC